MLKKTISFVCLSIVGSSIGAAELPKKKAGISPQAATFLNPVTPITPLQEIILGYLGNTHIFEHNWQKAKSFGTGQIFANMFMNSTILRLRAISWSPDSRYIASNSSHNYIQIWDTLSGTCVAKLDSKPDRGTLLIWSPGGKLCSYSYNGRNIWNLDTCRLTDQYENNTIRQWSDNGKFVTCLDDNSNTLSLFDTVTQSYVLRNITGYRQDLIPSSPIANHNGTYFVRCDQRQNKWIPFIWAKNSTQSFPLEIKDSGDLLHPIWSPDGKYISFISYSTGPNGLLIYDISSKKYIKTRDTDTTSHCILCLKWSPNGKYIASGSHNGNLKIWDTETGICITTLREYTGIYRFLIAVRDVVNIGDHDAIDTIDWSPDSRYIATTSRNSGIIIWENKAVAPIMPLVDAHKDKILTKQ